MTSQQINERIALLCGWTVDVEDDPEDGEMYVWTSPCGKEHFTGPGLYAESLDKCREFESPLYSGERDCEMSQYIMHLGDVVKADGSGWSWKYFRLATASPRERCEAFLRMKWQWE